MNSLVSLVALSDVLNNCDSITSFAKILSDYLQRSFDLEFAEMFELDIENESGNLRLARNANIDPDLEIFKKLPSIILSTISNADSKAVSFEDISGDELELLQNFGIPTSRSLRCVMMPLLIKIGPVPHSKVNFIRQVSSLRGLFPSRQNSTRSEETKTFVVVMVLNSGSNSPLNPVFMTTDGTSATDSLEISIFLQLLRSILSSALENKFHREDLNNSYTDLQARFRIVNAALASSTDLVMILNKDGDVLAANKKIGQFLRDQQLPSSSQPNTSRKFVTAPSVPSSFFGNFNPSHTQTNVHFSKWLEGCTCTQLFQDIDAILESGNSISMKMVTMLSAGGHFQDMFIDYSMFAIDSSGKMVWNHNVNDAAANEEDVSIVVDISAVVVILKIADKSTAFTEIIRRYSHVGSVVDVNDVDTPSGIAIVAGSLLESCASEFNLPEDMKSELNTIHSTVTNLAKEIRVIETAPHRITSVSCKEPHRVDSYHSGNSAKEDLTKNLVNISRQLSLEFPVPGNLKSWDFNALDIEGKDELCCCIGRMFAESVDLAALGVDIGALSSYISVISRNYHDNPFHNFRHATTVCHFVFMMLHAINANSFLPPIKLFSILVACLVHDVDHPGNTNAFEINCGTELALRYNDQSVLENHHCSTAFRLMRKPGVNILQNLRNAASTDVRKTTVACVLGTDMAVHFQMVEELKKFTTATTALSTSAALPRSQLFQEQTNVMLLCRALVHSADLSNPVRSFFLTRRWAELISLEFNAQVAKEEELGLPILGFMVTRDVKTLCKNEIGFSSFVVAPLWKCLASLLPELSPLVQQLERNQVEWKQILDGIERAEEEEEELLGTSAPES